MKHFPILITTLLLASGCCPTALHAAPPADSVLLDQNTFGAETHQLPANDNYGLGANSIANPIVPLGKCEFTSTADLKRDEKGLPAEYSLWPWGQLMIVPEAENFRMTFVVQNMKSPKVDFRWRELVRWGNGQCYRLDLVAGTLTKINNKKSTLLAEAKVPLLNGEKREWPPLPLDYSAIEITARNGEFQVRVALDGQSWQDAIQCQDAKPIPSGAIWMNDGQFGDVRVEALPSAVKPPRLAATEAKIQDAMFTSMAGYLDVSIRQEALDYLSKLATPVPGDVSLALAIAQSNQDLGMRLAALRASKALQLTLDVPTLLLDGLSSKHSVLRDGAANALINLKLPPEQMLPKVVDALVAGDQFARFDVKKLITSLGEPFQAEVVKEIQKRFSKATDSRIKIGLVRALSRDSLREKPVKEIPRAETLALLAQALGDSSAEVRLAAIQTLRWLESPLAWKKGAPNVFLDHPEQTAQIVKLLQAILKSDAPATHRAEAVGCLAEMRQDLDTIIAALGDKDAAVRSTAAQGLCCFPRSELQGAIPALQKLSTDADCKTDAEGTLGYIQNDEVARGAGQQPLPSPCELSPEALLAETARRVDHAASASLAMQAELIPFPNDFLAHYSAQLALHRNRQAANARLCQNLYSHSFNGCSNLDSTKIPLVYALHNSRSRYYPGGLTPETEKLFKETMLSALDFNCNLFDELLGDVTIDFGSENQSLQYLYGLWYMNLALLNEDPAYASRRLHSGKTVAEYYTAWNDYMKKWMRHRALNGFWKELGSGYCYNYSVPAILGIYTVATDPETRQLTKMFLDLAMLDETQADFNGVRGANGSRYKGNGISSASKGFFSFFADGKVQDGKGIHQYATSGYRLPDAAVLLRAFEQYPPQPIVIANRRLGEVRYPDPEKSSQSANGAPENSDSDDAIDHLSADTRARYVGDSKAVSYLWKTRHYMLGSMLRDPKTVMGGLYKNAPWNGVVFASGKGLFPHCLEPEYYSFQHKNVFIFQRSENDKGKSPTQVDISPELKIVEENGWVFLQDGNAYVGIKILQGGYKWEKAGGGNSWQSLVSEVPTSPIIIEGGDSDTFGSFDKFKGTVQKNTITLGADKVEYRGPGQPQIEFFFESTGQASKVDGKPWTPNPEFVYSGPFLQRKEGESVVTVTVGGKRVLYDFDKATITDASDPK